MVPIFDEEEKMTISDASLVYIAQCLSTMQLTLQGGVYVRKHVRAPPPPTGNPKGANADHVASANIGAIDATPIGHGIDDAYNAFEHLWVHVDNTLTSYNTMLIQDLTN
ncbi:hypothetical protein GH714_000388 [Hevea brasiliensis]|uniref:Uncharacterized protein n=1 Tax=Hevea brasiliensis TaxID=3981 RepID=A0A6A6L9H2_HEVBR|nr:hypothetical protein GH714_000388 [Hevea brasiliensis]